ncbi:hypothetical protein DMN91_009933 [Ooceraea biroi]|uniref:Putative inorganic phosphate cotransporter n=1 Tax=Ooceraea biroi TaxID=2015173 RepID=A0A026W4L0_OOCBI|nr:putative inorganic phosphate cotransporter [Ooceraea biroi]EZA50531.1 Putative inorganic phosphate cotransporter [Ooceraea biroi]RLU17697.1 hypothetical protein DMN91_009933 [Ooceraea biroi]
MKMSPTLKQHSIGIRHFEMLLLFVVVFIGAGYTLCLKGGVVHLSLEGEIKDGISFAITLTTSLTIFYWTSMIAQLLIGFVVHANEGSMLDWVIRLGFALTILMIFLGKYIGVYIISVIMAIIEITIVTCVHGLLAVWIPPSERALSGAIVYGGASFSKLTITLAIMDIAKTRNPNLLIVFYALLIVTAIWGIVYFFLGAKVPSRHRFISQKEREYIEESLRAESSDTLNQMPMSLKNIVTSPSVWVLIIAHCCQTWLEIILSMIPIIQIFSGIVNIATWETYLTMWLVGLFIGCVSDIAVRNGTSMATARKICNTIGFLGPAIALLCLNNVDVENWNIIAIVAMGLNAGAICGFRINHIDLSPKYASLLVSISNFFACILSLIVFYVMLNLFVDKWYSIVYATVAILGVSNVIFVVFGKARVQYY